jgi:putative transposase
MRRRVNGFETRNDFKLARETIESIVIARPKATRDGPQGLCLDKGYDYDEVRELLDEFRFARPTG